jgi:phosphoribosylanthranilate isomerase
LLDNINPGSGVKMDFNGINKNDMRLFLAGGINISNIDEALKLNPYCIDVSSGVEVLGYKDDKKIEEITRRVKEYE